MFHCFDIDKTIPPTKAAQEETPAKSPKPKKVNIDDVELKLKKLATPILSKIKKAIIIKIAISKAIRVELDSFLDSFFSFDLSSVLPLKSENS